MTKPSQNLRPHKPDNMQPSSVLFPKNRNSNLELLRIVCMLFIICHHWIVFILDNCGYHVPLGDTKQDYTSVFLNSFFIIGVNCYVLISGYFGIKLSWKPIKKIVGACLFYGALCYFISLAIPPFNSEGFSFLTLLERMYPGNWWFLMEYIVLILLSPMLNKSIENIDSKTFRLYIILLLIVNVGIGYCLNDRVNKTGYNIMNFHYALLHRTLPEQKFRTTRRLSEAKMVVAGLYPLFGDVIHRIHHSLEIHGLDAHRAEMVRLQ